MNQLRPMPSAPDELSAEFCRQLMDQGALQQALVMLTMLLRDDPENRQTLLLASDCYWEMQQTDKAMRILEVLLAQDMHDVAALGRLGSRFLALGNREGAGHAFGAALELAPDNVTLIAALDLATPIAAQSAHADLLRKVAEDQTQTGVARRDALNTLGRIADRDGDHAGAMALFLASKAAQPGTYDRATMARKVAGQKTHLTGAMLGRRSGTDAKTRPVFITGVPRSGTSLLEAMIARHPEVASVGESMALARALRATRGEAPDDWAWCKGLAAQQVAEGQEHYFSQIAQVLPTVLPVTLDKMPRNIFGAGFAAMALPGARFIYLQRHPLDIGVSLLMNNLSGGANGFTRSQEDIAHYILQSQASAEDYQKKLGSRFRMQSYPALIAEPEGQMKEVLRFLELDWDADVLAPEDTSLSIRTASALQVRAGLNRQGLDRWRRYEAQLQPMIEALGGWGWIRAWEAAHAGRGGFRKK